MYYPLDIGFDLFMYLLAGMLEYFLFIIDISFINISNLVLLYLVRRLASKED